MPKSDIRRYDERLGTLKKRREWLDNRIIERGDKVSSYDLQEVSAIDWAIAVIEANQDYALELIAQKRREKEGEKNGQVVDTNPNNGDS